MSYIVILMSFETITSNDYGTAEEKIAGFPRNFVKPAGET